MDKRRMINEAILEICEADDDGTEPPETFEPKVAAAVASCWREGITLTSLTIAARRKLGFRVADNDG